MFQPVRVDAVEVASDPIHQLQALDEIQLIRRQGPRQRPAAPLEAFTGESLRMLLVDVHFA
jgi:hypothetical protein